VGAAAPAGLLELRHVAVAGLMMFRVPSARLTPFSYGSGTRLRRVRPAEARDCTFCGGIGLVMKELVAKGILCGVCCDQIQPLGIHAEGEQWELGKLSGPMSEAYNGYSDTQLGDFWRKMIDHQVPPGEGFRTQDAAALAASPILVLATEDTGWEWARNIYRTRNADRPFTTGAALTTYGRLGVTFSELVNQAGATQSATWTAWMHSHVHTDVPTYYLPSTRNPQFGVLGDIGLSDKYGLDVYVASDRGTYVHRAHSRSAPEVVR
jgi:hypothetical protein